MAKRAAKIVDWALCYPVLLCPFCKQRTTYNDAMPWCSNRACLVEYSQRGRRIVFDDARKTPRFALAKAFMAAGGVRIGAKP